MKQAGNHAEFLRLYNAYYKAVYYTSLGLLHQADEAADCMQDTFAALWESLQKGEKIANPGGWLMTVARHTSLGVIRRRGRLSPLEEAGELPTPGDETSRLPEETLFIARLLTSLPEPEREVFHPPCAGRPAARRDRPRHGYPFRHRALAVCLCPQAPEKGAGRHRPLYLTSPAVSSS